MRRRKDAVIVLTVILALCLSGCSSAKGFSRAGVVEVAKDHGMARIENNGSIESLKSTLLFCKVSSYYVAKDKTDAQEIYDKYINEAGDYPKYTVDDVVIIVPRENHVVTKDGVPEQYTQDGELILVVLGDEKSAEQCFEKLKQELPEMINVPPVTGKKDGYQYGVSYSFTDTGKEKAGVYQKGKSVLVVFGNSYTDLNSSFADYIFKELGIVDPTEGK